MRRAMMERRPTRSDIRGVRRLNYSTRVNSPPAAASATADLTMVLPTYNERERLAELVAAVFSACAAHGVRLELEWKVIGDD